MNQGMQQRMQIESGLRHALGNGELLLHYQPKFEIGSGRLVGAEALVRWRIRSAAWCRRRIHPAGRDHRA
jgi:sensor c-di-GMP phosphodiesterase-like protein